MSTLNTNPLSETDKFVLTYLTDEEIKGYNGVNGAMLEARRRDELAAQQLTIDMLMVQGILVYEMPPCPDYPQS